MEVKELVIKDSFANDNPILGFIQNKTEQSKYQPVQ
jgi:hypothetical protein